jgi:hypothetical protein
MSIVETIGGARHISRNRLERADRKTLVRYLEARGFQCYPGESIRELRECALEDLEHEADRLDEMSDQ